jgi:uncharacterized protein YhaN
LLESILTRAEREFREIHQPDVLRRASGYLEKITDGRYLRVDLLDEDKGLLGVALDEGRERLPLILDDALLRIDDHRRKGVYTLLGGMAPTRQVWILTCHRALADEIEGSLKVSRIDL